MKKIIFKFVLSLPLYLCAHPILDLLEIEPSAQSRDFVMNKKQFQLHALMTEQRHPNTWDLSQKIQFNTLSGIEALLSVDHDISLKVIEWTKDTTLLDQACCAIKQAILENKKIYIYGCGATGRLAKQMESCFWRPFWKKMQSLPQWEKMQNDFPNIENRLIGEMTGGDRALISSLEGFEDLQLIGKLQLVDHQIQRGDVIFAVTEGGETSSVIGTILAALDQYDDTSNTDIQFDARQHLYFIYNNPDQLLLPFDRSRAVIENKAISKICLFTGQQSIAGSTRMQATTSETFVLGIILEHAIYQLIKPYFSKEDLESFGYHEATLSERLLSFLSLKKAVDSVRFPISQLTDLESLTHQNRGFSTYLAQDALITVFIDSTERAPTFRLFPLDTCDSSSRKSWIQVWTLAHHKQQAWEKFLGRPFYGLNKTLYEQPFSEEIDDPHLKMAALRSLVNAGHDQQFLYDFSCSKENIEFRGPKEDDLGVMVLFANEIEQLADPNSLFRKGLKMFVERKAKSALILLPSLPLSSDDPVLEVIYAEDPGALVLQLVLDTSLDPLQLRQHIGLKMLLNAHSTGVMAKLGRVVGNTMTNVNPGNLKLIGRATFLIMSHVNDRLSPENQISYADANAILFDAIEYGKQTQKVGLNAEVGLCIIRILEALKNRVASSWIEVESILQKDGLEAYLEKNKFN